MMGVFFAKQFWILDPLYSVLGTMLAWFYEFIPSYGMAIVLLTLAVRVVTLPLTAKQAKAQQALQKVQPELKRLQAKYKGDKQKLNEEMMKFYKENHVNPFGSCLPLLIQAPVLIVLYRLIIGLSASAIVAFSVVAVGAGPLEGVRLENGRITSGEVKNDVVTSGTLKGAQAVVDGAVVGTVADVKVKDGKIASAQVINGQVQVGTLSDLTVRGGEKVGIPKHVPKSSELYAALEKSGGTMDSFWMDLSKTAANVKGAGLAPYILLILGVMGTGYYQQRQLTARAPKGGAVNPQMQAIAKIFPVMFGVISFTVPAGVVVYFLVSNLWQIGQQGWIFRNQTAATDDGDTKTDGKTDGKPVKSSGKSTKATGSSSNSNRTAKSKTSGKGKPTPSRDGSKSGRRGGRPADLRGTKPKARENPLSRRNPRAKKPPSTDSKRDGSKRDGGTKKDGG